jgi:hypothetical protein
VLQGTPQLRKQPVLTIQWSDLHRLNFKWPSFICPPTVHTYSYSEIFLINNSQCQNEVKNHTVPL